MLKQFFILLASLITIDLNSQTVLTFTYTGGVQTFQVPLCVTSISVEIRGDQGGIGKVWILD